MMPGEVESKKAKVTIYCIKDCNVVFNGTDVKNFKEGEKHVFKEKIAKSLLQSQDGCWVTHDQYMSRQALHSKAATENYIKGKANTSKSKSKGDEKEPKLAPLPPDTVM